MTRENAIERHFPFIYPTGIPIFEKSWVVKNSEICMCHFEDISVFVFSVPESDVLAVLHYWLRYTLSRYSTALFFHQSQKYIKQNKRKNRVSKPHMRDDVECITWMSALWSVSPIEHGKYRKCIKWHMQISLFLATRLFFKNRYPARINERKVPLNRVFSCHLLGQVGLQSSAPYPKWSWR